jgi:ParB family chromosome partitioning protein
MTESVQTETVSGAEIFVPLNKLKKSPRNVRKVPHGEAAIEALAAGIQFKGMLQNLVVEPEIKDGEPTGYYLVTIGEGRRVAQLLRAKRKQIKKTEPIRCVLDLTNDPEEISLDENVTRTAMHPADQFEAFRDQAERRGFGAEEIGARFGVSAQVVKQRLRLGAVSPRLLQVYRDGGVSLEQLMAFAITTDHARQEDVFAQLSHNKEAWIIRRDLTVNNVPAHDRRAVFVGAEAYEQAGGVIIRDLFTEDRGGYFEDAGLLDRLALEKLQAMAAAVQAEGWKWVEASINYPHAHGLHRYYPEDVALSDEDAARLTTVAADYDERVAGFDSFEDMPAEQAEVAQALLAEITALSDKRTAYDPAVVARGGVFVTLNQDGEARIERGFVRSEDEPAPEAEDAVDGDDLGDDEAPDEAGEVEDGEDANEPEDAGDGKPLSDSLIRDLTAHRTLGLRMALGEQPDVAMVALTHALVAQLFYRSDATCLQIRVDSEALGDHAEGIADTQVAEAMADRHDVWAQQLPRDVAGLWAFVTDLDGDSRSSLLAHCVALTVNAVKLPWERKTRPLAAADLLAGAVGLDMTATWRPTARSYFGRVTKAQIVQAVAEAQSPEAAERIRPMKKPDMAEAAEQLVAATGWLPAILRTVEPVGRDWVETEAPAGEAVDAEQVGGETQAEDAYGVAAE